MTADEPAGAGSRQVARTRFEETRCSHAPDSVAREEPLEIQIGGASLAVVMRTPGHDLELVTGFLLTERIVSGPGDIESVRPCGEVTEPAAEDNVVRAILGEGLRVDLERLRRNLFASSSCGVCGKATIEAALEAAPPLEDAAHFEAELLYVLPERLRGAQPVFDATGGLHGAALFDAAGRLLVAREDVGRHNAVDKIVGWAARTGSFPLPGHILMVSGRVSFEIVQKALAARIPLVAAVSAPSSLAIELAEASGIAIAGFLRGRSLSLYGDRGRIHGG